MKKVLSLLIAMLLAIIVIPQTQGVDMHTNTVQIIFDGEHASVRIEMNDSSYLVVKFSKIYLGEKDSWKSRGFPLSMEIEKMNVKKSSGWSPVMGNYTQVTMWKNIHFKGHSHAKNFWNANLTLIFYIAERNYTKGNFLVTTNMIRYDIHFSTNVPYSRIFLEEEIYGGNRTGHMDIYENMGDQGHPGWKKMGKSNALMPHHFGRDKTGMLGLGNKSVKFQYLWEYQDGIETLYAYQEQLSLCFSLPNNEGTATMDPYISLPVSIFSSGNITQIVKGVANYIMDHLLSFGLGILIAVGIIFVPIILRKIRL